MKKFLVIGSLFLLTPVIVFAQMFVTGGGTLITFVQVFANLVSAATPAMVGLALLFFFYGLAIYILNAGNEEKKGQGKAIMLWGVIAIFVVLSIFGLVRMLQSTFGIQENPIVGGGTATPPTLTR